MPTNACGGGTGQSSLPGVAAVALGAGRIAQLLEALEMPELIVALPFVEVGELVLSNFCNSDLPAMTPLTLPEAQALTTLQPNTDFESGLAKLKDYILNAAWPLFCVCAAGSSTIPNPPALPTGTPVTQNPVPGSNPPCISYYSPGGPGITESTPRAWGPSSSSVALCFEPSNPPGPVITSAQVTWGAAPGTGAIGAQTLTFTYSGVGVPNVSHTQTIPANTTSAVFTDAAPSGAYTGTQIGLAGQGGGGNFTFTLQHDVFCNGTYPGQQQPCCPPDPATQATLDAILNLVQVIQRELLPLNYTRGTLHPGITGTGTLTVSGLFGLLVEITSGVPTTPQLPGVPPYQWSVGWISMLTPDGFIDEIRLTRQAQIWSSRLAPYTTEVGYQINDGFVVNITELLPV